MFTIKFFYNIIMEKTTKREMKKMKVKIQRRMMESTQEEKMGTKDKKNIKTIRTKLRKRRKM